MLRLFEAKMVPAREALERALSRLVAHQHEELDDAYARAQRLMFEITLLIVVLGILGLLGSTMLVWRFTRALGAFYQRERAALSRAREATTARDEILRILAHDLRSPLTGVVLKATLIRTKAGSNTAVKTEAAGVEAIVMRMEKVIKSLLDAAKIEAGELSLDRTNCRAGDLISSAVAAFHQSAAARSLRLIGTTDASEHVFADRERILQVLSYLLDNAIKFTPAGTVAVSARRVDGKVQFDVSDSGRGIAPSDVPHVFERYWKADSGGKRGSGLGLYLAKRIVEAHGGAIWVDSTPDQGSTFSFTLPRAVAQLEHTPDPSGGAAHAVT
jgi:signal transduction histidine kinase